jgi:riboflavin kinase
MICMVVAEDLQCLKAIGLMGGCGGPVWVSSQMLGKTLEISPQTASRRLISLENQGYISRSIRPDGQYVIVSRTGEEELRREYAEYCRIFERHIKHFTLEGVVTDGLGEGRYYVALPGYRDQFNAKLGFDPYPGTLNIQLTAPSVQIRKKLDALAWIEIDGFTAEGRTFGSARCLSCTIEGHQCAIIMPGRTHYPEDVVEIISPVALRKTLDLTDRDVVRVEVEYD